MPVQTAAQRKRRRRKQRNAEAKAADGEGGSTQKVLAVCGTETRKQQPEFTANGLRLPLSSYRSAPTAMLRSSLDGCVLYHRPQKGRPGLPMQVPWEPEALYRIPLGCAIWNAGIILRDFVASSIDRLVDICGVDRAHVLELGAGTGVCGLALVGQQRVASMTLTDGDPVTLRLLEFNNQSNQNHATVQSCRWGQHTSMKSLLFGLQSRNHLIEGFDMILASDCTYNAALAVPFWSTIANLLTLQGVVVLAHVVRERIEIEKMLQVATQNHFKCFNPECELNTVVEGLECERCATKTHVLDERGKDTTIEVYMFKRVNFPSCIP